MPLLSINNISTSEDFDTTLETNAKYLNIQNNIELISNKITSNFSKIIFTDKFLSKITFNPNNPAFPTHVFPLLFGPPANIYSYKNPSSYNKIINNTYNLDMPGRVFMQWGAPGEYNVYKESRFNFGTITLSAYVKDVQGTALIFRKAFDSNYNFIGIYFDTQPLKNGENIFTVTSQYGNMGVAIEQIGIMVVSNSGFENIHSTCNVLSIKYLN